jgi:hypothetical protein
MRKLAAQARMPMMPAGKELLRASQSSPNICQQQHAMNAHAFSGVPRFEPWCTRSLLSLLISHRIPHHAANMFPWACLCYLLYKK